MVSNVRTMKMNDDVLVVAVTPDAKYIAVALLDCTVKVDSTPLMLSILNFIFSCTVLLCLVSSLCSC